MHRVRIHAGAAVVAACILSTAGCARRSAQPAAEPPAPRPAAEAQDSAAGGGGGRGGPARPRPYDRVITAAARTDVGLFTTHRIGDRLYFEVPRSELGKEMLVVTRTVAGGQTGGFFGGGGDQVVTWERDGNRIRLRRQSYDIAADSTRAIHLAVSAMRTGPIIASFDVESWGPDSAAVIDVGRLYTSNVTEFRVVNSPQSDRSYIESVAAYPENVNVIATQTGTAPQSGGGPGGGGNQQEQQQTVSVRAIWSMMKLPEDPMRPRLHDARVGFGSITYIDYSRPEHRAEERRFIRRFRLQKRNPQAQVSDPVEPIVFWIDPATPEWLVPWVKTGIEAWQPAFREAGFSNAIVGREAPSPEEDPDWSPFDARYSIVYWRPSTVANATGGQVEDPRTGEILKAEVNMYHNVMNLLRNWYFTQVGPLDPRAQKLPLPDSLMGRLVQYVVTHEVGHAIGFPHNMKASAMYPADSLRSAAFLRRMGGHVATLMDYSRFNYVAQPEDGIPPDLLIPQVGPYDRFAVMWGHTPIPGARTPDEEWPTLDRWSRMQDTIPWFRFTTAGAPNDPFALTEAVGDQDAVKSNALGLRNLRRVKDMLLRVSERPGQDYELLDELYGNVISQWGRYNGHVAAIVGAAETQERYGTGPRFEPVDEPHQRDAVRFLNQNAFRVPDWLVDSDILRRIEAAGFVGRVRQAQARVLESLLSPNRLNRMIEYEAIDRSPYSVADLLADLRTGIWSELAAGPVEIDVFRRNLQRAYVETLGRHIDPPPSDEEDGGGPGADDAPSFTTDARAILRGHLAELDDALEAALPRAANGMTRLHLRDLRTEIANILDPGT